MLEGLCGNKNIQKILIFLFVNGKCYGTQLHKSLKTALTPLQKALNRLEKGGLITSYYEGKTRIYQFNPAYPLLDELEKLLKKAYTLLPAHSKQEFYVGREDAKGHLSTHENKTEILLACWNKLVNVSKVTFHAKSKSKDETGWNGKGQGEVTLVKSEPSTVIFHEKGVWINKQETEVSFSNVFRWTLDRFAGIIALEHLRRGEAHPVFLFHLSPSGKSALTSVDSHLCAGDTYFGQINFDRYSLKFHWRVIGPNKNEEIVYYYS